MNKIITLILISFSLLVLAGCETTTSRPYAASTDNVLKLQSALKESGNKVVLENFTESKNKSDLNCRLMGPVDVSAGKSRAEYIKEAMQTELFMAQVYDINASTKISGNLNSLKFSSASPARWEIDFSISSNKSEGYSVKTKFPFKTSYSAYSACKNVADAFGPAVQQLIEDIILHPNFNELVGK